MLASLTVTAAGVLLLLGAAFAHSLLTGLMALGGVLALTGLIIPERTRK